jgi:hypothetical protein
VGLDGYTSETVEQTGTDSDCDGRRPSYYAWYEFYPAGSFEINMTIKPGDRMSAKVVYSGSEFTIMIEDVTTGKSYSQEFNGQECEAVVGRMDCRGALLHLRRRHFCPTPISVRCSSERTVPVSAARIVPGVEHRRNHDGNQRRYKRSSPVGAV